MLSGFASRCYAALYSCYFDRLFSPIFSPSRSADYRQRLDAADFSHAAATRAAPLAHFFATPRMLIILMPPLKQLIALTE